MKQIYLDYAATTPAYPEVVQSMLTYFHDSFLKADEVSGNLNKA
jgi:cysteine sulfinate desulfinase/cysteine desulfurase-like protein